MKWFIRILAVLFVAVSALYFVPVTKKEEVIINAEFSQVLAAFNDNQAWKHWYGSMSKDAKRIVIDTGANKKAVQLAENEILISKINPLLYAVTESRGNKPIRYTIALKAVASKTNLAKVLLIEKTNALAAIFYSSSRAAGIKAVEALQKYFADETGLYGYHFFETQVSDTIIATKTLRLEPKYVMGSIAKLFAEINSYIIANNLEAKEYTNIAISELSKDSLQLMVGIPVNKPAVAENGITCVRMPYKGRLLATIYEGTFAKRFYVYNAMQNYIRDKGMNIVALPFEQYERIPLSDSLPVRMTLYIPVL